MDKLLLIHSDILKELDVGWAMSDTREAVRTLVVLNNKLSKVVQISLWMSWKVPVILEPHKTGFDWYVLDTSDNKRNLKWMTSKLSLELDRVKDTLNRVGPDVHSGHSLEDIVSGATPDATPDENADENEESDDGRRGTSGGGRTLHGEGVVDSDPTLPEPDDGPTSAGPLRSGEGGPSEGSGSDEVEEDIGGEA